MIEPTRKTPGADEAPLRRYAAALLLASVAVATPVRAQLPEGGRGAWVIDELFALFRASSEEAR